MTNIKRLKTLIRTPFGRHSAVARERRREELTQIVKRSAARPIRDKRSADEILGYGPDGLPS